MFNNPTPPSSSRDEGTVMQVDLRRHVCKVVSTNGQKFDNVQWLVPYGGNDRSGDRFTPRIGDQVYLDTGRGRPIILGFLPRPQSGSQSYPLGVDTGAVQVDTGNYAPGGPAMTADASKPQDMLLGDRIIGSQGGGLIGLLRAGSLLLRSSRAAEILLSRIGDLVRIVGRNLEVFTDLSTDVYRNFRGRVYRYFGVSYQFQESRDGTYRYHQFYGDVAAAEAVRDRYHTPPSDVPVAGNVVFKEKVTDAAGVEKMHRSLNLEGHEDVVITGGGTTTRVSSTHSTIVLTFNEQHIVTIDPDRINLHHAGGADILMTDAGILSTFHAGTVEMRDNGVFTTFDGHYCNVHSGGVDLG